MQKGIINPFQGIVNRQFQEFWILAENVIMGRSDKAAREVFMAGNAALDPGSAAVQHHLTMMQGIITRMAENSRSCKLWCVTLVAAVLVLVARTEQPHYALLALLPAGMFLILDTYYLALERAFRDSYNAFVRKLHQGELQPAELYRIAPTGSIPRLFFACLKSFAIWPFYPALAIMIGAVWAVMGGCVARLIFGG